MAWWRPDSFERFVQDASYAGRIFRRAPGFTIIVILTLSLGIGATTAVFSILNTVLLQPLPFHDPGRLIVVWERQIHAKGTSKIFTLYTDYENWKRNARSFESVAAVTWASQASPGKIMTGNGPAQNVFALPATAEFFSTLGVSAIRGRTFDVRDTGRGCFVVLTDKFWQNTFGGKDDIIGHPIRLDDQSCTVLGVMPPGFAYLPPGAPIAMWSLMPRPARPEEFSVAILMRLRHGVTMQAAQAEVSLLHHQIHEHDRWGTQMEPVVYDMHGEFTWLTGRNLELSVIVLFAAVSFVLLICCVNVANLLLGRAVGREKEMAIRAALGSGRARLLRQLFTENLLLSSFASIGGCALAVAAVRYFRSVRPIELPPGSQLGVNATVLAFAALLCVVTAVIFGLAPAWQSARVDINHVLKGAGRGSSRGTRYRQFGKGLIVLEVMLTVMLLAGAGLLIQTVNRFASVPLGFRPEGLVVASVQLPSKGYQEPERRAQFYERVREEVGAIPGVDSVAFSSTRPIVGGGTISVIEIEGHPAPTTENAADTFQQTVSPNYFAAMSTPVVKGRSFANSDAIGREAVAVVNEALVRKYFPGEDPIGRRIRPFAEDRAAGPWLRIIGIVGDEKRTTVYQEMAWATQPMLFKSVSQNPPGGTNLVIRVTGAVSATLARDVQATLARIDPEAPLGEFLTVKGIEDQTLAYPRFRAVLLGGFAGLALLLAVVGLFGVLSHLVAQRTQEIGVRMALGAQRGAVLRMILREGLVVTGGGVVFGVGAAWWLTRFLSSLLYGVQGTDVMVLAGMGCALLPIALAAMYLPARRAANVDPVVALRYE